MLAIEDLMKMIMLLGTQSRIALIIFKSYIPHNNLEKHIMDLIHGSKLSEYSNIITISTFPDGDSSSLIGEMISMPDFIKEKIGIILYEEPFEIGFIENMDNVEKIPFHIK